MESELQHQCLVARTPSPRVRDSRSEQNQNCNGCVDAFGFSLQITSCDGGLINQDRVTRRGQNHLVLSPSCSEARTCLCKGKASNICERRPSSGGFKLLSGCFFSLLLILRLPWSVSAEEPAPMPQPSMLPTRATSLPPFPTSDLPTDEPSQSFLPSSFPSLSHAPSDLPSRFPTPEPTFETPIVSSARFFQRFITGNGKRFSPTQLVFIESLYIGSTDEFIPNITDVELKVETKCSIIKHEPGPTKRKLEKDQEWTMVRRGLQQQLFEYVDLDFEMTYTSVYINVTKYPISFQDFINSNNHTIVSRMQTLGLNVTHALYAQRYVRPVPTLSPSLMPSAMPSIEPSKDPSANPSTTISFSPSTLSTDDTNIPAASVPTGAGVDGPQAETVVIVVSVIVAGSIVLVGSLIYFRKRKHQRRERTFRSDGTTSRRRTPEGIWSRGVQSALHNDIPSSSKNNNMSIRSMDSKKYNVPDLITGNGIASPSSESLISNPSLLSTGNFTDGGDTDGDDDDATYGLADEFDQYKDQNLEKMRMDVEGNITGFDGMMSQALTRALIDEDDDPVDSSEFLWGGSRNGAEIEASALGEVTDWLKRKENASLKEK
eukprot:scaffold1429_cov110-Cylindrotheca_fusiformis.AAC.9